MTSHMIWAIFNMTLFLQSLQIQLILSNITIFTK